MDIRHEIRKEKTNIAEYAIRVSSTILLLEREDVNEVLESLPELDYGNGGYSVINVRPKGLYRENDNIEVTFMCNDTDKADEIRSEVQFILKSASAKRDIAEHNGNVTYTLESKGEHPLYTVVIIGGSLAEGCELVAVEETVTVTKYKSVCKDEVETVPVSD